MNEENIFSYGNIFSENIDINKEIMLTEEEIVGIDKACMQIKEEKIKKHPLFGLVYEKFLFMGKLNTKETKRLFFSKFHTKTPSNENDLLYQKYGKDISNYIKNNTHIFTFDILITLIITGTELVSNFIEKYLNEDLADLFLYDKSLSYAHALSLNTTVRELIEDYILLLPLELPRNLLKFMYDELDKYLIPYQNIQNLISAEFNVDIEKIIKEYLI